MRRTTTAPRSLRRAPAFAWLAAIGCLAAGCGKKGPPLPPLRVLPEKVQQLQARQIGDRIVVSFSRPGSRDDGTPLPPDASIEVLLGARGQAPRGAGDVAGEPSLAWVIPRAQWDRYAQGDRLDVSLGVDGIARGLGLGGSESLRGRPLSFTVQVVEAKGRRSAASAPVTLDVCDPPPPPRGLRAHLREEGIVLEWMRPEGGPSGVVYNLYRQERAGPTAAVPLNGAPLAEGRFLDATAAPGVDLRYVVRAASPAAPACESRGTRSLDVVSVDLFPPAPPQGLAAVAEGGIIRLFWRPGRDADLRGYRVWRAAGAGSALRLLTPRVLTGTTFSDQDVSAGVVYSYAVTAVDGASPPNESGFSDTAVETAGGHR